jgi:hypothetical protein
LEEDVMEQVSMGGVCSLHVWMVVVENEQGTQLVMDVIVAPVSDSTRGKQREVVWVL